MASCCKGAAALQKINAPTTAAMAETAVALAVAAAAAAAAAAEGGTAAAATVQHVKTVVVAAVTANMAATAQGAPWLRPISTLGWMACFVQTQAKVNM